MIAKDVFKYCAVRKTINKTNNNNNRNIFILVYYRNITFSFFSYLFSIFCGFITENLRTIPAKTLDPSVEVLIMIGSKSHLTISPVFIPFTKLQVLQINDANVQSIGMHSFWGVQSLRILGTKICRASKSV